MQDEFTDPATIDREDFLLVFKKFKALGRVGISKGELKKVFASIDKSAGGEGRQ